MPLLPALVLASTYALAHGSEAAEAALIGGTVAIRKVGYPKPRVHERAACGQRLVKKSILDPEYFFHVIFGGFHEGTCDALGYTQFEEVAVVHERSLPLGPRRDVAFDVYSRDPTLLDVAGCIGRECGAQLSAFGASGYVKDLVHCVGPAFGRCRSKAWACLGDSVCRSALECLPHVARQCGEDAWRVVTDAEERKKVACIWECGNSTSCVVAKCGKEAIECFLGIDRLCHRAVTCVPDQVLACSRPAFGCVFGRDSVCRANLACISKGADACADPAVNMLTDHSIPTLMTCANQRCPAPAAVPEDSLPWLALPPPAHFPEQLACMGTHCAGQLAALFEDKDIGALSTCLPHAARGCGGRIRDCLGDDACRAEVSCWSNSVSAEASDVWRMITDKAERTFDEELFACVSGCSARARGPFAKAFCIAGTCGVKAVKCMWESTCRSVFTDLPEAVLKCSAASLRDPRFKSAAQCVAQVADACGRAGIELIRDQKLNDVVTCNAKCTRTPEEVAVVV